MFSDEILFLNLLYYTFYALIFAAW